MPKWLMPVVVFMGAAGAGQVAFDNNRWVLFTAAGTLMGGAVVAVIARYGGRSTPTSRDT